MNSAVVDYGMAKDNWEFKAKATGLKSDTPEQWDELMQQSWKHAAGEILAARNLLGLK